MSEANNSEHWTKKHRRHKTQKTEIWVKFQNEKPKISLPCIVTLTRIASRKLDDDNLLFAFKYIRDEIADHLVQYKGKCAGRSDSDDRLTWVYKQEKGRVNHYAIRVEVETN